MSAMIVVKIDNYFILRRCPNKIASTDSSFTKMDSAYRNPFAAGMV